MAERGEEMHLRRTEDPLPELDFDDLAEGVATVVNRRPLAAGVPTGAIPCAVGDGDDRRRW